MNGDERWARVEELLDLALDLTGDERNALLERECVGDPQLRINVERLLQACDEADGFLTSPLDTYVLPFLAAIPSSEDGLSAGAIVSHYEILQRVGEGGMGIVYKARDLRLGRSVALKFLPRSLGTDDVARARLEREARTVSALDHPHLAVVHEIGETEDGQRFIAMAWYEGRTLRAMIDDGPVPLADAMRIAVQTAAAAAAAHRAGVVHRDIKPSNVIVTADGSVRLLDFGIAKIPGADLTREGTTVGTVAYMSPEQTRGDVVDQRTDVWSLGVLLYEMLAGRRPFRGATEQAVIYSIRNDEPEPIQELRPEVGGRLSELIASCLAKAPSERCPSAEALYQRLREVAGDTAAVSYAHGEPWRKRAGLSVKPRSIFRGRPLLAAGASLATIAALTVWAVSSRAGAADSLDSSRLDPSRIVVAPFENRTGSAAFEQVGHMAADWLIQGLAATRLVDVVPVPAAFAAARFVEASGGLDSGARIRMLAGETRAAVVVTGSYYEQQDSLYLRAMVTDVRRDRVLHAMEPVVAPVTAPLAGIEQLRERMLSALAPSMFPMRQYEAVVSTPPLFESYAAFMRGVRLFLAFDFPGSVPQFALSASLDSSFTLPLIHMGTAYAIMGNLPALDSLLGTLRPRADRMNEIDRLGFDILSARVRGDLETFYRLSLRAPAESRGTALPWQLANAELWVNRPRELIRRARQLESGHGGLREWRLHWINLAQAYHLVGDHREELRVARRARDLFPAESSVVFLELHALAAMRRVRELEKYLAAHSEGPPSPARLLRRAGLELQAHGAQREGEILLRRSLDWQLSHPRTGRAPLIFLAESHALVGNLAEADSILASQELEHPGAVEIRAARGSVAARRGDRAQAMEISDSLAAADHRYARWQLTYPRARIAAQLGDRAEAVRLLRQAYSEGMTLWPYLHIEADLSPLWDYPPFVEFLRPRG
jgi:serine/threonine protein kinase